MSAATATGSADPLVACVLTGGVALGAYQLGALQALSGSGTAPDWIASTSIGAVNGALFAGNEPERRMAQLEDFWRHAAFTSPLLAAADACGRWFGQANGLASAAQAHLVGNPGLFRPRVRPETPSGGVPSLYDNAPLRRALVDQIDFDRLNSGEIRFTVTAVEIASGREVVFDTAAGDRIGPDHLIAACGFLPDFAPVEIDGRVLGDGGLRRNAPVHLVVGDPAVRNRRLVCFVVDLFATDGPLPRSLAAAFEKRLDLVFGTQTDTAIEAAGREHALRRLLARAGSGRADQELRREAATGSVLLLHLSYLSDAREPGSEKMFDFSQRSIQTRFEHGMLDMKHALSLLEVTDPVDGFVVHRVRLGGAED